MTPADALSDPALLRKWLRYQALFRPLGALPSPLAYRGADLIGSCDRRRQPATAAAVSGGLRRAFPVMDDAELRHWLTVYFRMLAREITDVFKMRHLDPARRSGAGRRLAWPAAGALQHLRQARAGGRGVIIAMGHYGRVNMLLLGLALAGERLGMLTMMTDRRNPQLDPVDRPYIDKKIKTLLSFTGGPWVTLGDDLRHLYRALEAGRTLVILLDAYTPEHPHRKLQTPFLGGTLQVSRGVDRLAEKTGARVLYGCARERGYRVEAELRLLPAPAGAGNSYLHRAVAELEKDILAAPGLWWQWGLLDYLWQRPAGDQTGNEER